MRDFTKFITQDLEINLLSCIYRYKIRIGDFSHTSVKDDRGAIDLDILNSVAHPDFNREISYYDVAVLLTENITFSRFISPICLPDSSSDDIHQYDHRYVELTGWGRNSLTGQISHELKRVSLEIYPLR